MLVASDVLMWLGLGGSAVFAASLSRRRKEVDPIHGLSIFLLIQVSIGVAFFVQPGIRNLHGLVAALTSLLFTFGVFAWISQRGSVIKNQEWALGLCVTALWTFGSLFQSRMHWEPDPEADWKASGVLEVAEHLARSLSPLLLITGVMALLTWPVSRHLVENVVDWVNMRTQTDRARLVAVLIALVVLVGLNCLARVLDRHRHLTVVGLQVGEFTKPLWLIALVMIFVWWSDQFVRFSRPTIGSRHREMSRGRVIFEQSVFWVRSRSVFLPLALWVGAVGFSAVIRDDFGSAIAPALALAGMLLCAIQRYREQWRSATGEAHRFHWRIAVGTIVLLLLAAPLFILLSPFVGKLRSQQWLEPWSLPWYIDCMPVDVPALQPLVPSGYTPCAYSYSEYVLEAGSQMAKAQVVIDGGGLWGRGLADIEAGIVGAAHTDFIFASAWSKLGALTVALLVALTIVVCVLLFELARRPSLTDTARGTAFSLSALGLMFAGQTVYVLLANSNLVPHSGVPAPLLSYGTQASGFMLLMLWAVIEASRRTLTDASPSLGTTQLFQRLAERFWLIALLAIGLVLSILAGLLMPYRSFVPLGVATGLRADLRGVSSQVAAQRDSRIPVTVFVDGESTLEFDRGSRKWTQTAGESGTLRLTDLNGLIRGPDGQSRALDVAIVPLLAELSGGTASRFMPRTFGGIQVDLALNSRLQRAAQQLVVTPADNGLRYPMGLVILDPASGAILASASSPSEAQGVQQVNTPIEHPRGVVEGGRFVPLDDSQCDSRDDCGDLRYGYMRGTQLLALSYSDCRAHKDVCLVLDWRATPRVEAVDLDVLSSYTGGLPSDYVHPPIVGQDRVMNRAYGPASVFKVIIAAAYLRTGGSLTDRVPAPAQLIVAGRAITNNYADHLCPLTSEDGTLSLEEALAVSCNTPFVWLAKQIGWSVIAEMASSFGFVWDNGGEARWPVASVVPSRVDEGELATSVLGGGEVVATPLQLATVMATIANGGVRNSPVIFTGGVGVDGVELDTSGVSKEVLTQDEAVALQKALAMTSQVGTMAGITDRALVGKTGTMELHVNDPREYYGADLWYVGYTSVEATGQPLAFALVAEVPRDYGAAQEHVRYIVGSLVEEIGAIR